MDPNSKLARAFRMTKADHSPGGKGVATYRLAIARRMVSLGKPIYGGTPGEKKYQEQGGGLRFVGRVVPESGRDWLDTSDSCGWYTDPFGDVFRDGSGLCFGVVYQLPGRKGVARFVAGYEFGGVDGGPTLDLTTVYVSKDETEQEAAAYYSGATRAADGLAELAAEKERTYQTAWQAGSLYAERGESVKETRIRTLELLRQNRESGGSRDLPAIHATIVDAARSAWRDICDARSNMAQLVAGDYPGLLFYPDTETESAFCEGAGIDAFPA